MTSSGFRKRPVLAATFCFVALAGVSACNDDKASSGSTPTAGSSSSSLSQSGAPKQAEPSVAPPSLSAVDAAAKVRAFITNPCSVVTNEEVSTVLGYPVAKVEKDEKSSHPTLRGSCVYSNASGEVVLRTLIVPVPQTRAPADAAAKVALRGQDPTTPLPGIADAAFLYSSGQNVNGFTLAKLIGNEYVVVHSSRFKINGDPGAAAYTRLAQVVTDNLVK